MAIVASTLTLFQRGEGKSRFLAIGLLLVSSVSVWAADDIRSETFLSNLRSPAAIAVRPTPGAGGYEIYVAEVGAGRIVRLNSDQPNMREEAITGFIASTDDDELSGQPGPHGLLFLDANRLVVAGSEGERRPFVRLYEFVDQKKPLSAEQHEQETVPTAAEKLGGDVASFNGLARTMANDNVPDLLVLSATLKDGGTSAWRLPVRSGTLGELKPLDKEEPDTSSMAVAVEPRGYIVVIRSEERSDSNESRLEFVNPVDGRGIVNFLVKLPNVVGAAYSPRTGNLYAVSTASRGSSRGGVYRIDADESKASDKLAAVATLVAEIPRPTALAFGPDGVLYVTSLGGGRAGGSLMKVSGGL